jgi:hypothetical protein
LSERLAAEAVQFWREALDGQQKAWAAWLLTIVRPTAEGLAGEAAEPRTESGLFPKPPAQLAMVAAMLERR